MRFLSAPLPSQRSEYDRRLMNATGVSSYDALMPSHEAAPVYSPNLMLMIQALEGDEEAIAAVRADAAAAAKAAPAAAAADDD